MRAARVVSVSLILCVMHTGIAVSQAPATITGRILDSLTRTPLAGVHVIVVGQGEGRTTASGQYTVSGVRPGAVVVRARLLGYAPGERRITVGAGEMTTLDFTLPRQTAVLDQVVITGTAGETQRRAIGNVVESINASDVLAIAPVMSVDQVIGGRTPGVIMLPPSGQVGTGSQVRVRGASSMSLTNDPIIYVDGVRMDGTPNRGPGQRGGLGTSRLDDIAPEDIETIEVIKGPAASTLYGTEASNGVIQIRTKRGR